MEAPTVTGPWKLLPVEEWYWIGEHEIRWFATVNGMEYALADTGRTWRRSNRFRAWVPITNSGWELFRDVNA